MNYLQYPKHNAKCDAYCKLMNVDYLSRKTTCRVLIAEPLFIEEIDILSAIIKEKDKALE
ncbi:hypothetical protein BCT62_22625 [Vibrio splendidus]|nr:hypothetical protein BCT62_22625 [Vibrio splendidus]PMN24087.1 hypothetical protein BCT36_14710 [Vibrio splendidus]